MFSARHANVRTALGQRGADALLLTNPFSIQYLTGFRGLSPREREAVGFITTAEFFLFVPAMYAEQCAQLRSVQDGLVTLIINKERDGLLGKFTRHIEPSATILFEEDSCSVADLRHLESLGSYTWRSAQGLVSSIRVTKDEHELAIVRDVVSRTDKVWNDLVGRFAQGGYVGLREYEVVDIIRVLGREHGLTEFAFEPIVAAGVGSSQPHYRTGEARLESGMPLLVDFGFTLDGYHSDLTRTIHLGPAPQSFKETYHQVLDCNKNAISGCVPGKKTAGELHKEAVAYFYERGVADAFIHGLGHGVGLEVHEEPFFRPDRSLLLQKGMVVTIEPGLYYPGRYGIRIEDLGVVTETGLEVLSCHSSKELLEL